MGMALISDSGTGAARLPAAPPDPPVRPPATVAEVAARIEARLTRLLDAERDRLGALDPDLTAPLAVLGDAVLDGGKRLRPAFCYWGWCCAGGVAEEPGALEPVDDAGAALELLHAFALVHDDVMDDADRRRGVPTVHVTFAERHRHEGWRGERRRVGESVAILVGDLAHTYAEIALGAVNPRTRALWQELQVELMAGQYLDVLRTASGGADQAQARRIARLKSGRYTVEQPLRLGASLLDARRTPDQVGALDEALVAIGEPLGMAFQLRDDVLGVVGDPARTGKPVGDDLREGKPTPILALADERADRDQRRLLERVGAPDLDDDEVQALVAVLVDTGALDAAEAEVAALAEAALAAVEAADLPPTVRSDLAAVVPFVAGRHH
jgi:geranylgeranyl diphosphate synthase type I